MTLTSRPVKPSSCLMGISRSAERIQLKSCERMATSSPRRSLLKPLSSPRLAAWDRALMQLSASTSAWAAPGYFASRTVQSLATRPLPDTREQKAGTPLSDKNNKKQLHEPDCAPPFGVGACYPEVSSVPIEITFGPLTTGLRRAQEASPSHADSATIPSLQICPGGAAVGSG